jgi:Peptidase MA superfamily
MGVGVMKMLPLNAIGRRLIAALACAPLALMCLAGQASAADVSFGSDNATSQFGQGIVFTQDYTGTIKSATILISIPNDSITQPGIIGPTVATVTNVSGGTLSYTLDTVAAGVSPFSPVVGQFELVLGDGTIMDGPKIDAIYADDRFQWKTKTGSHVRLHYIDASDSFAQQMLDLADAGVKNAASMFGVADPKPIDYYVYPSQSAFQQGLSEPGTVGGVALPSYRACFAIVAPGDTGYAAQVMPHEPTHVIFSDATGNPYHEPPRWLNEGFAQYIAQGYDSDSRSLVTDGARQGTMPSLLALTNFFPLDSDRIYMAYAEAVAAVDMMVRKYGKADILKLVGAYAKGDSDDQAFQAAFGVDVATFDAAFMAANDAASTKYGPQPEPTSGPRGAVAPGSTATPGNQGETSPVPANRTTVYLLAGVMAIAGLILMGAALSMVVSARSRVGR